MNVLVFDTETIGKVSQDLINVGYRVVDLNPSTGEYITLKTRDYLISPLISNRTYCLNDDFVGAEKLALWDTALSEKKAIRRSLKSVLKLLSNDIKKYSICFTYAYNNTFDLDKFEKAYNATGLENPFSSTTNLDIWSMAYKHICNTEDYKKWSKENENFTVTKQYIATSVEGVCKYLYNDKDFKELHTALDDTGHELYILCECVCRGCDITKPLSKAKFIESELVQKDVIVTESGSPIEINYTKKITRGNKIIYKG